ncbi:hypothetical protein [Paenibacillus sp. MMS20-IR301]|uniref:hypothetical protein n=1 Tax=Paenibacillus sp. MMS20-IR301 TaxID=2895946 RepID=UPI0028E695CB|nr:hypothetical protein [Paenibacillus sp. MMS20-IR301]WNS42358.1 hypothetical protein LOS79_25765 [Paenibacillus sp. MMS20-IR301]
MKKLRSLIMLVVLVMLFSVLTPWAKVSGSSAGAEAEQRVKLSYQWMGHSYTKNQTGHPILRMTRVDYSTGLFTNEDVALDFIDTAIAYRLDSVSGRNTKNPLVAYGVMRSEAAEKIMKYDSLRKVLNVTTERAVSAGTIEDVYPDAGMYVVKNKANEYEVYSLSANKLLHKSKQPPREYTNSYSANIIDQNYFDPEPSLGALYYGVLSGTSPYELKADGTINKLHSYKKTTWDNFVYKKTLSASVIFKQSKAGDIIKHELVINGKVRTLLETNLKRADYASASAQISPTGKYIVLWVSYIENKKKVKGKEEYRVYDAGTGTLIRTIPLNITGPSSLGNAQIRFVADTDHIIQSSLMNPATYRTIDSNLITPWSYGNVLSGHTPYYNFSLNDYVSMNDPVPVSFNGKYMRYSGQGTFRSADLTLYSPVGELMALLGGTVASKNGRSTVSYQESSYTLDPKKQIVWKSRTYYPLKEILSALSLKSSTKGNLQAADDWLEFQITR